MWGGGVKKVYHGSTLVFGKQVFERVYTASGTITLPSSLLFLQVVVVGGGAGGSGGNYDNNWINSNGSGSAGGYTKKTYTAADIKTLQGKTVSFTVGAGGAGGATHVTGGAGGTSSFLSLAATGGNPSSGYSNWGSMGTIGAGGIGSGGDENKQGAQGQLGQVVSNNFTPKGGAGWSVAGGTYGSGGNGGVSIGTAPSGVSGCVYVIYYY